MVTQLERPSRITRGIDNNIKTNKNINKSINLNFISMLSVGLLLDGIGVFLNFIPGIGIIISFISNLIFIPWFYFSGIKFTGKKIASMGATSILEYIPLIGNLPLITTNIVFSYYSK